MTLGVSAAWFSMMVGGAYSVSVTGILIGCFLYDVLNPAVGWLRRS